MAPRLRHIWAMGNFGDDGHAPSIRVNNEHGYKGAGAHAEQMVVLGTGALSAHRTADSDLARCVNAPGLSA